MQEGVTTQSRENLPIQYSQGINNFKVVAGPAGCNRLSKKGRLKDHTLDNPQPFELHYCLRIPSNLSSTASWSGMLLNSSNHLRI